MQAARDAGDVQNLLHAKARNCIRHAKANKCGADARNVEKRIRNAIAKNM